MTDAEQARIEGPSTATLHQVLGWVMRNRPASGSHDAGDGLADVVEFLQELEELCGMLGWDFAVVAAHALAATEMFSLDAWQASRASLPLPADDGTEQARVIGSPREAARVHVTYLTSLVRVDDPEGDGYDAAVEQLTSVGYQDLIPAWLELDRAGSSRQARVIGDLATGPLDAGRLGEHLEGIRSADAPAPGDDAANAAPPVIARSAAPFPDIHQWIPTSNYHARPNGMRPTAICHHITDDLNLWNVIGYFQSAASEASATFVIDRDGKAYQMINSLNAPWTNGDYKDRHGVSNRPRQDIPWLNEAIAACERREHNLNDWFITYELIGKTWDPATEAQYLKVIELSRYFVDHYGISPHRGHQLRHSDINSRSRSYDPGNKFNLRRIIIALGGDPANLAG